LIAETMSRQMIKRGLKGTRFSRVEPVFPADLDGIGWYIHLPFCRRLCPYCCFHSLQYSPSKVAPYIEAVKKEILTYRDRLGKIKIGDVYFGGGTPSLTWEGIVEVMEFIRSEFEMEGEFGFEANPEDINAAMCQAVKQAGVTKISLGVQSFDDKILRSMRRGYDAKAVLKAIELLLGKGFYVSIDLLNSLPRQQISSLLSDLEMAAKTRVHQISHYPLMLFPHTRWYKDAQKGEIAIASSQLERKMFYAICDFLTANGYRQATCWDFTNVAKAGRQYATCTRDENIGVGLSAYTKIGGLFYVNTFSLSEYIKSVETGLPIATGTITSPNRVMRRWFMMGLYRLKVEKAEFEERFGVEMEQAMGRFLLMLKLLNIVKEHPGYIQVTRGGMYWASLMTKASMLTLPARYYEECLQRPWPDDFQL
jgi:coproporphyrinogen III oxidase-like Fe-S oxidoreductase